MRNNIINEDRLLKIIRKTLLESDQEKKKVKKDAVKPRCIPENVIPLDEIVGNADDYIKYAPGIKKKKSWC